MDYGEQNIQNKRPRLFLQAARSKNCMSLQSATPPGPNTFSLRPSQPAGARLKQNHQQTQNGQRKKAERVMVRQILIIALLVFNAIQGLMRVPVN